jgi:hypothetical protein
MTDDQAQLAALRARDSKVDEALSQLERILGSRKFSRVQQHTRDFLIFVVTKKLLGQEDHIKETTIAIYVFHEPADYNTAESSKIRVAARELRKRLAAYHAEEGRNDPLEIVIPTGTYVPELRDRRATVAVGRIEDWNPSGDHRRLCRMISQEILARLGPVGGLRSGRVSGHKATVPPFRYKLRGSLESLGDGLRLNVSLSDLHADRSFLRISLKGDVTLSSASQRT